MDLSIKALPLPEVLLPPGVAMRRVTSKDGFGVYASSDTLYKGAVFGRDSIEVAEDLLSIKPKLVKEIILTLASLQGLTNNPENEEEPGKIIHEFRRKIVDGKQVKGEELRIFKALYKKWGGQGDTLAYYGSVDATPHYLRLLGAYCKDYDTTILTEDVTLRNGESISVFEVAQRALQWLEAKLINSRSGMLEYQRKNSHGIENQVWKDSKEFYVHEDGTLVNHEKPIASIEVQGLAYDALQTAASLFPDKAEDCIKIAEELKERTTTLLWLPERRYFALGVDYDSKGKQRIIKTPTANPAALLDSGWFDTMPAREQKLYVGSIIKRIMSKYFLTDAGIRSRSLAAEDVIPFWDYHGSFVTWPKETYDIAKGLRRQGFPRLAKQLENRIMNVIYRAKQYPEFIFVDGWGRVLASPPKAHEHGNLLLVDSPNKPEKLQAWTISAALAITYFKKNRSDVTPDLSQDAWRVELEDHILKIIKHVKLYSNRFHLVKNYPPYPYRLEPGWKQ